MLKAVGGTVSPLAQVSIWLLGDGCLWMNHLLIIPAVYPFKDLHCLIERPGLWGERLHAFGCVCQGKMCG